MHEQQQVRLPVLIRELEVGPTQLQALEWQQNNLRETLLRISGAIQVLQKLLASPVEAQDVSSVDKVGNADAPFLAHTK
jgi:hypothetical protein